MVSCGKNRGIKMINNYEEFKKHVFDLTSIDLNAYKEKQMKRRIDTLIARNKYNGYDSYSKAIKTDSKLLDEFVNYLTINVSEFYRNPALWQKLENIILPELISKFGTRLKIWSAACSTGDEPYSLAMVLAKKVPMRDIKIYATDIDDQVLEKAKVCIQLTALRDCQMNTRISTLRRWVTSTLRYQMILRNVLSLRSLIC